jgi:2-octaprenyl-6-methoxyphenol hydroxylase
MNRNFDIIIIGGSFTGMATALTLANISNQLKIALVEKQNILEQERKADGRAYAISNNSLKIFQEIEILEDLKQKCGTIKDIKITDYKSSVALNFLSKEILENNFGLLIENFHIHNALKNKVLQKKNITLFCPNSYQEINFLEEKNLVEVKLENQEIISAKLLLACDGRFSKLREYFQIHTTEKHYQQNAIVFNIKHQIPHQNFAYEKFLPNGPIAILPLKSPNECSIVWIVKSSIEKTIFSLDEENFLHQLEKKMENILGKTELISEKFSYPLILVEAEKFYHKKMLLVGDSACGVHPIAGQGFNLAIKGIEILKNLITQNLFSGGDISSQNLIEEYNKKYRKEAKKMIIATDILNSLFESTNFSISFLRKAGIGLVDKIPQLKKFFIKNAGG